MDIVQVENYENDMCQSSVGDLILEMYEYCQKCQFIVDNIFHRIFGLYVI
jgi:hypothetical protein